VVQLRIKVKGVRRESTLQCESVVQHSTPDCCPIRALWGEDKLVVKATRGLRLRWEQTHCALHASIVHHNMNLLPESQSAGDAGGAYNGEEQQAGHLFLFCPVRFPVRIYSVLSAKW
jgi:hypothetical protein